MDKQTQSRVDQLLLEQGEYSPLEFLLAEGRLHYSDYERWREGEIPELDAELFGDPLQITEALRKAAEYARALGLETALSRYTTWGADEPLVFSRNETLEQLFLQGFRKSETVPQMDLFMDTAGASLANGIILALGRRQWEESNQLLEKLYQTDPGHPKLGALERLLEAVALIDEPVDDAHNEMNHLQGEIAPLAEDLLGKNSVNFLVPLWRRLHAAVQGRSFDSQLPRLHASFTAANVLDWVAVVEAVEAESRWREQPVLLQRHAHACEHLQRPADAMLDRFALCWRFPHATDLLSMDWGPELIRASRAFQDLEPELDTASFPAWLLIIRPGMTRWLPAPEPSRPEDYRLVFALQQRDKDAAARDKESKIEIRNKLKQSNPNLFRHFIANLSR